MIKQEVVDELRIAIYEDVGLLYDFYSDRWKEDSLRDAQEYVPGITQEELDEYCKQDVPYINALLQLATKAAKDEALMNGLFEQTPEKAYELVKGVTGDAIPYEDFLDILEYGGKPFFKAFEGTLADDEMGENELDEVIGGIDGDSEKAIAKTIELAAKVAGAVGSCFTADSPVDTPSGPKAIKNLTVGDIICSLDKDGKRVDVKVTDTTQAKASVIEVHFADGRVWNTTSTQGFYDGKRFHNVWQHRDRDIVTLDGTTKITDIIETGRKEMVYDLVFGGNNVMFINGAAAEGY